MRYTKRNMALKLTRVSKQLKVAAGLALFASLCSATGSLATVTSGDPFSVDGVVLASPGVASWPVITNDEVSTTTAGALLTFRDGSAVKLDPQSRVKLAGTESAPEVILIAGNLQAKLAPGSRLLVTRVDTDKDKDTGSNTTPTVEPASTGVRTTTTIFVSWCSLGLRVEYHWPVLVSLPMPFCNRLLPARASGLT